MDAIRPTEAQRPELAEVALAEVRRDTAERIAQAIDDTAQELWRVFLRLPHTPSPLGDYVQRRVAVFREQARIAREEASRD